MDKHREIKGIYDYANRLRSRFPSYVAYVQRLNQLADAFVPLLTLIQQEQEVKNQGQSG